MLVFLGFIRMFSKLIVNVCSIFYFMSYYNYSIDEQIESLGFVIVHCFDAIMIAEKKLFTNFCTT